MNALMETSGRFFMPEIQYHRHPRLSARASMLRPTTYIHVGKLGMTE